MKNLNEKAQLLYQQHKFLVLLAFGTFTLFLLSALLSLLFPGNKSSVATSSPFSTQNGGALPQNNSLPQVRLPTVKFTNYTNTAKVPIAPSSLTVYSLKNNFSLAEIRSFA